MIRLIRQLQHSTTTSDTFPGQTFGGADMELVGASLIMSHSPVPGSDTKSERIVQSVRAQGPISNLTSSFSLISSTPARESARIRSSIDT
ncbi:hypothetical protein L2E82_15025 [Cichorium intybus]|uniref:Uncharacterized protein n=1 Tax=Cichorium intybus TaxID=13427 RepID=A0ACB9F280_CICIN|nr:hypothetical protein L2E82_15025 [Cichorium intybus]